MSSGAGVGFFMASPTSHSQAYIRTHENINNKQNSQASGCLAGWLFLVPPRLAAIQAMAE